MRKKTGERGSGIGFKMVSLILPILVIVSIILSSILFLDLGMGVLREETRIRLVKHARVLENSAEDMRKILSSLESFVMSDLSHERLAREFPIFSRAIVDSYPLAKVISVAPGGINTWVHPGTCDELSPERNLLEDEREDIREGVMKAISTGQATLIGPLELRQGGMGLVARKALFVEGDFWGLVSVVFDFDSIVIDSGIIQESHLEVSLSVANGELVFGNLPASNAESESVEIIDQLWELHAKPVKGWLKAFSERFELFLLMQIPLIIVTLALLIMVIGKGKSFSDALDRATVELKKRNLGLIQEVDLLNSIAETTTVGIISTDVGGSILFANERAEEILGFEFSDLVGSKHNVFTDKLSAENVDETFEDPFSILTREKRPRRELMYLYDRFGSRIRLRIDVSPIRKNSDELKGTVFVIDDVTRRVDTELALKKSKEELDRLFEHLPGIAFRCKNDKCWTMELISPGIERLTGYKVEEIIENHLMPYAEIIHPEDRQVVWQKVQESIPENREYEMEYRVVTRSGEIRNVLERGRLLHNEGEENAFVEGFISDVTELKKAKKLAEESRTRIEKSFQTIVKTLSRIVEIRDPFTAGHQRRVSILAGEIAEKMRLEKELVESLRFAGLLHDIGKLWIPSEILNKPGKLSSIEMTMVREHPRLGHDVLKDVDFGPPVADYILQHQERLDGSGYPSGLKGDTILLPSRILAVADVVEAMVSHRPYRPSLGIEAAIKEIESNSGILYDEEVVKVCVELLKEGFRFD